MKLFSLLNDIIIFGLLVHACYFTQLTKLYVSTVAGFRFSKLHPKKNTKPASNKQPNIKHTTYFKKKTTQLSNVSY